MTGDLILAGVIVLCALYYVAECCWWPFANCRKCDGAGRFKPEKRKVWRNCRRCKGSGRRLRIGRRVYNFVARVRRDAS
jgi:hypothetical protein